MKKMILALVAVCGLLASPAAQAQTINQVAPNELSFSYGVSVIGAVTTSLINTLGVVGQISDGDYIAVRSGGSHGILNLGYHYHTSKVFGIGANFSFNRMSVKLEDETGKLDAFAVNCFSLMADAKLNWFRREVFGMYSRAGLGVMCLNTNLVETASHNFWLPALQLSPIGMEVGRSFCGFMELGFGMQGIAQFGVRYHF